MRRVLARQTRERREAPGPDALQPDQADPGNRVVAVQLGSKRRRQLPRHDGRVDAEVDQQPALDRAVNVRQPHRYCGRLNNPP